MGQVKSRPFNLLIYVFFISVFSMSIEYTLSTVKQTKRMLLFSFVLNSEIVLIGVHMKKLVNLSCA